MNLVIVSGGQTGVDRAALDVAMDLNIPSTGWCPKDRWAEDGPIDERYPLTESASSRLNERTEKNILDSDGTLVLIRKPISDSGTKTTLKLVRFHNKPYLLVHLEENENTVHDTVMQWLETYKICRLNVAGPRESNDPGIYQKAYHFLHRLLKEDS